jgi:hypothetical protein
MKHLSLGVILAGLASCSSGSAAAPSRAADPGFTVLFNGKDFTNWKLPEGDNGHWKIVDGVIDYDALSEAKAEKHLFTEKEYGDFVLKVDWRLKEAPYMNNNVPVILPDGTHKLGPDGKELKAPQFDADSGIYLRDRKGKAQVNIWTWPIGSGEVYGYRMDKTQSPEVRAAVTPKMKADRPVGEWNSFVITLKGTRLTVVLNGHTVIENADLPGLQARGPIGLQHHGAMKDGKWTSPPALVQYRNIEIKELN